MQRGEQGAVRPGLRRLRDPGALVQVEVHRVQPGDLARSPGRGADGGEVNSEDAGGGHQWARLAERDA